MTKLACELAECDALVTLGDSRLPSRWWKFVTVVDCGYLTSCWLFKAHVGGMAGYKLFSIGKRSLLAHRHSYAELVGPIPSKLTIDHLCFQRSCVRPEHLEAVTRTVNTLRSSSPSALNARKAVCDNGHLYTPENTFIRRDGRRDCRSCMYNRSNARRKRLRQAKIDAGIYRPPGGVRLTVAQLAEPYPCGHPRTSENTIVKKKNHDVCRECNRTSCLRRYYEQQGRAIPA